MKGLLEPFRRARRMHASGVLGINARNLDFVAAHNPRRLYPKVDDKTITKKEAIAAGVTVPETYAVMRHQGQWPQVRAIMEEKKSFVIKPARGSGGGGIMVVTGLAKTGLRSSGGRITPWADVRHHISNILSGMFSMGGGASDKVIIEERLKVHPAFDNLAFGGVPDVRVIVFRGVPVMGMLRLPTAVSDGKANLHMGGVGAGLDIAEGVTTRGVQFNEVIELHPDFETPVTGFQVPQWDAVLEMAAALGGSTGLGYVGVDIVIDAVKGPTLLELNARPGIAIQTANRRGLKPILKAIADLPREAIPLDPKGRAELARQIWRDTAPEGEAPPIPPRSEERSSSETLAEPNRAEPGREAGAA